jgi:HAD superfamily hydrolase (TIGR01509 family)
MTQLYGLIFDVDGVIADTEPVNARVTIRVFEDMFGLEGVRPEDFAAGIGKGAEAYVKAAADVHKLQLTDRQIKAAAQLRQDYFLQTVSKESLQPFPGVLGLMNNALQDERFRLAIATSGSLEMSRAILESAKVPYKRMIYVTGSEVARKKPDPQLFLVAASRMGIRPANCVVFEDAPSGVQAAKAAGARCIAVTNSTDAENLRHADLVCDSLEQINLDMIINLIEGNI